MCIKVSALTAQDLCRRSLGSFAAFFPGTRHGGQWLRRLVYKDSYNETATMAYVARFVGQEDGLQLGVLRAGYTEAGTTDQWPFRCSGTSSSRLQFGLPRLSTGTASWPFGSGLQ